MGSSTADFLHFLVELDLPGGKLIVLVPVAELALVPETPGVDIPVCCHRSRVVLPAADVDDLLSHESLHHFGLVDIVQTSDPQLPERVVAPHVHLSLVVEGHGEVWARLYPNNWAIEFKLNDIG